MNLFKSLTCGNKHDPGLNGAELTGRVTHAAEQEHT